MNLQRIVVRVTEMSIGTTYSGDKEVAKVTFGLEKGQALGLESLHIYAALDAGVPNPFTLGQRLAVTIDAEHVPALLAEQPEVPPATASAEPAEAVDDEAPAITDEVVGLGERFDRDVMTAAGAEGR